LLQLVNQASLAVFFFVASRLGNAVAEYDEQVFWSKTNLFHLALPLLEAKRIIKRKSRLLTN
jgi:hypothetical protein